ncbi:MAG: PIN domain-containing protein [Armatimonadetes bacterium]|nr:PIN domain-containing protein [Armatimonadota bacterium]
MTLPPSPTAPAATALVDTDVVSFFFKRDSRARLYVPHLTRKHAGIGFLTWAELEYWTCRHQWGPARYDRLHRYRAAFALYDISGDLNRLWGRVRADVQAKGRVIEPADAWIAAAALLYDLSPITHNRKGFEAADGLTMISEAP